MDCLKKLKPKVLDLTIEGMIMYHWLSLEALEKVMGISKKIQENSKEAIEERMFEIQKVLIKIMENKEKRKLQKGIQLLIGKEQSANQIN